MVKAKSSAIFLLLVTAGCLQMRDYTGIKEGAFGLDIKKGFGEGKDKKDYYLIKEGVGFVIGDSKNEVINVIGLPDRVETTIEGYENWIYKDKNLSLFFKGERLNGWRNF